MPIRYDMHMHSSFSTDSDTPMQSMVENAMKRGLFGICFTEHMDLDYPAQYFPEAPQAFAADPEEVCAEVIRLRALLPNGSGEPSGSENRSGSFWIGFGLEFGMQPHLAGRFHEIATRCLPDFITASQHLVRTLDPFFPETWEDTDPADLIESYYREMQSNLKSMQDWDTLSHMDYIIRYIPNRGDTVYDSMSRHQEVIDEILRYVISCGKCLEVNTAGCRYGLGQPNPSPAILRRYRELGGENITIGSDAHKPEQIAFAFDQTPALLRSLGFDSYCIFHRRNMQRIPLSIAPSAELRPSARQR